MRKSVIAEEFGGPEKLKLIDEPSPDLTPGMVRVEIKAVGVNRADILQRSGAYHSARLPVRPGLEASGVVIESDSTAFSPGMRVVLFANRTGLYTTETIADPAQMCPIPDAVTFERAAALPINWLTAWYCLHRLIQLRTGETVLIPAAVSGVGHAAIQIAKDAGAVVIAGTSTEEKAETARALGADHVVLYRETDFIDAVRGVTDGKGVEAFLDVVGGRVFAWGLKVLAPFGRVAALANVTLEDSLINTRDFYPKNAAIFGFQYGNLLASGRYDPTADMTAILDRVAAGTFIPHVAGTFPLRDAAAAHRLLESRGVVGKLLLVP